MRHFFKLVTSSCLGTILAFAVIFFIFLLIGVSSAPQQAVPKNGVLHITLDKTVPELSDNVAAKGTFSLESNDFVGLHDMRRLIEHAKTDDKIKGILLQTENTNIGTSKALEIAKYIRDFKESGKFVHAYGNYYTQVGYVLASVADSVWLNPNGLIGLSGYGTTIPYFKDFSEKTKIDFDVYHAGKFKSAIEPYYRSEVSKENRLQTQMYLNEYQDAISAFIAEERGLSPAVVEDIIVNAKADDVPEKSLELGLVDKVDYWQNYWESLKAVTDAKKPKLVTLEEYETNTLLPKQSGTDRIAVVYAEGTIGMSGNTKGQVTMERYRKSLRRIRDNDKIKAVVLRVDSPGGSALTSDNFWSYIEDIKASGKYVVASFGRYAASGGYYIACGADEIVAEPTTLTGSIGVYSMIPQFHEFFDDNVGIDWDTIGTGNYTFMYSSFVERSPAENAKLMSSTDNIYQRFLSRVAAGRDMTVEQVNEIAQGRVWSGTKAKEIGLVDQLGNLQDAIALAAKRVESDSYKLLQYPVIEKTFYEEILSQMANDINAKVGIYQPSRKSKMLAKMNAMMTEMEDACETPQARLPFVIME